MNAAKAMPPSPGPSEHELIVAAQAGDRAALDALVRVHWRSLRRQALVLSLDAATADDVLQEALVRVVRFVHRCDPERGFGPWARGIVRNVARDSHRRVREPPEPPAPMAVDRRLDLAEKLRAATTALGELSPRQREVLDLCGLQGQSPSEAARELDIAPGTARALLHQGRKALRARLLARGPDVLDLTRDP